MRNRNDDPLHKQTRWRVPSPVLSHATDPWCAAVLRCLALQLGQSILEHRDRFRFGLVDVRIVVGILGVGVGFAKNLAQTTIFPEDRTPIVHLGVTSVEISNHLLPSRIHLKQAFVQRDGLVWMSVTTADLGEVGRDPVILLAVAFLEG